MIYAFLILVILLLAVAFMVNALAFKPPQTGKKEIDGRKVYFSSGKNRLIGYLWNETGTCGLVILAHGMGTDIGYYLPELHHFADAGYRVFAFEYSGYGESTGHFYGFPQAVSDLKNAIAFIDDGSLPLILLGHSMGGYAVCAVPQSLERPVRAIVAYAPFYAPGEAIREMTYGAPYGSLLRTLVVPVQRILFGACCGWNGAEGLRVAKAPALILQGSDDKEVTCEGCSMYAHRSELVGSAVSFRLIGQADSNGHMTVIRKKDSMCVNEDTMKVVDAFLGENR